MKIDSEELDGQADRGCARVSIRAQDTDRQVADLLGAGVRRVDLLNLGGENVDTGTPWGSMVRRWGCLGPTVKIKRECLNDSNTKRRVALVRSGRTTSHLQ